MSRSLILLLVGLLVWPAAARAADSWSTPFSGIKRLHRKTSSQNINVLVIDLCAAGVSLRATASSERKRTVPSFGALVGAQAAINGDFFSYSNYSTNGLAAHGGAVWSGTSDHSYVAPVAIGANKVEMPHHNNINAVQPWMKEIVSGHPTLLDAGTAVGNSGDPLCTNRHPRTVIGLSKDRRTMYWGVVDGRASGRIGMTCTELITLLKSLGAHWAVNMDGGGSSTMWVSGKGVVNYPSDGSSRVVANHLAVFAKGSGAAPHCSGHPVLTIDSSIETITGQKRDFCKEGASEGIFDWNAGQKSTVQVHVKNKGLAVAKNVTVGIWAEDPHVQITHWSIYSDWNGNGTFSLNDTDAMQTIGHDNPGSSFSLKLYALSPGETKRVTLKVKALAFSVGIADHPDIRAWVSHVDDYYEKTDFSATPNNVGGHQTQNGGDLRTYVQTDVLDRESCDGVDNDCDALIDEDGVCGVDGSPALPDAGPAAEAGLRVVFGDTGAPRAATGPGTILEGGCSLAPNAAPPGAPPVLLLLLLAVLLRGRRIRGCRPGVARTDSRRGSPRRSPAG